MLLMQVTMLNEVLADQPLLRTAKADLSAHSYTNSSTSNGTTTALNSTTAPGDYSDPSKHLGMLVNIVS